MAPAPVIHAAGVYTALAGSVIATFYALKVSVSFNVDHIVCKM